MSFESKINFASCKILFPKRLILTTIGCVQTSDTMYRTQAAPVAHWVGSRSDKFSLRVAVRQFLVVGNRAISSSLAGELSPYLAKI